MACEAKLPWGTLLEALSVAFKARAYSLRHAKPSLVHFPGYGHIVVHGACGNDPVEGSKHILVVIGHEPPTSMIEAAAWPCYGHSSDRARGGEMMS